VDENRFDTLTRALSGAPSRRSIVRALAGVASGLAAAGAAHDATAQKNRKKKRGQKQGHGQNQQPCPVCQQRVNGRCDSTILNTTLCGECGVCFNGACGPAKRECGGLCTFCDETATCRTSPDGETCLDDGTCVDGKCRKPL